MNTHLKVPFAESTREMEQEFRARALKRQGELDRFTRVEDSDETWDDFLEDQYYAGFRADFLQWRHKELTSSVGIPMPNLIKSWNPYDR